MVSAPAVPLSECVLYKQGQRLIAVQGTTLARQKEREREGSHLSESLGLATTSASGAAPLSLTASNVLKSLRTDFST